MITFKSLIGTMRTSDVFTPLGHYGDVLFLFWNEVACVWRMHARIKCMEERECQKEHYRGEIFLDFWESIPLFSRRNPN